MKALFISLLATVSAWSGTFVLTGARGGLASDGYSGVEYLAGSSSAGTSLDGTPWGTILCRNWFEFLIPALGGTLISATVNLQQGEPAGPPCGAFGTPGCGVPALSGHGGPPTTFTLSALAAVPTSFSQIGSDLTYGTVSLDSSTNGTIVNIPLDAAALTAIAASSGGEFLTGGVDSGETSSTYAYDFGNLTLNNTVTLTLVTATDAPGPSTPALLIAGLVAVGVLARKPHRFSAGPCRAFRRAR